GELDSCLRGLGQACLCYQRAQLSSQSIGATYQIGAKFLALCQVHTLAPLPGQELPDCGFSCRVSVDLSAVPPPSCSAPRFPLAHSPARGPRRPTPSPQLSACWWYR